jgi:hypothetical protein
VIAGTTILGATPAFAATTPNQVFNLSQFQLTLPIGTGGVPTVVSTAQLEAGFTNTYFKLNSSNHLVFTAPSNGDATDTPGHTRSELHEFYTGPNAATSGCWTSALGGTLTATAYIEAVSADSDEATIGQIHASGSNPFVLLIYRPASKVVALDLYPTPGSAVKQETVIKKGVALDTQLAYTLAFHNGLVVATVNGQTVTVAAGSTWASSPVRFDLGAYSEAPNTGNPAGDKTEVTFDSFSISHP